MIPINNLEATKIVDHSDVTSVEPAVLVDELVSLLLVLKIS